MSFEQEVFEGWIKQLGNADREDKELAWGTVFALNVLHDAWHRTLLSLPGRVADVFTDDLVMQLPRLCKDVSPPIKSVSVDETKVANLVGTEKPTENALTLLVALMSSNTSTGDFLVNYARAKASDLLLEKVGMT